MIFAQLARFLLIAFVRAVTCLISGLFIVLAFRGELQPLWLPVCIGVCLVLACVLDTPRPKEPSDGE